MQITLERQKRAHANELEKINASLEKTVQERTQKLTEVQTRMLLLDKESLQ
ncbi:MAG TPA: hypothetical protein VJ951_05290 [Bacteroidales bacterium]|nr:hypothetical protein [Bacteroidales bacterium]